MTRKELYVLLELPEGIVEQLNDYEVTRFVSETKDDSGKYSSSHGTFQQGTKRMKF